MKILITGSEGVLGTALKHELRSRGHEVWGCDLMHTADPQYTRADIAESAQLERAFRRSSPEVVYALAAEFGRMNGADYPSQLFRSNCLGLSNTIEMCERWSAHMVFASSSEAYGTLATNDPLKESDLATRVPSFHNFYALTKYTGEKMIECAMRHTGLRATVLRFFNCYGRERYSRYRSVVSLFVYRLLHRQPITVFAQSYRDFLYIDDWTPAVANVADRCSNLHQFAYNIGGSDYRPIAEMANLVAKCCGVEWDSELICREMCEAGNVSHKRPDITLARRDLDHNPKVRLEEGIPLTVEWMRKEYGVGKAMAASPGMKG